ncbi:hypothetical protein FGO68_gene10499 [Halteria grandinella]|uniref:Fe2OG dioxygenase domain-containing protein n=1 Tax=Halteria grandinella TaxID=5974 RepID=A0A8J8T5D1_HALGN|nr:hypothetical protein FGO68_gene10499 [Halteria grandinella]
MQTQVFDFTSPSRSSTLAEAQEQLSTPEIPLKGLLFGQQFSTPIQSSSDKKAHSTANDCPLLKEAGYLSVTEQIRKLAGNSQKPLIICGDQSSVALTAECAKVLLALSEQGEITIGFPEADETCGDLGQKLQYALSTQREGQKARVKLSPLDLQFSTSSPVFDIVLSLNHTQTSFTKIEYTLASIPKLQDCRCLSVFLTSSESAVQFRKGSEESTRSYSSDVSSNESAYTPDMPQECAQSCAQLLPRIPDQEYLREAEATLRRSGLRKLRLIPIHSGFIFEGYFTTVETPQFSSVFQKAPVPSKALTAQLWLEEPEYNPLLHLDFATPTSHCYTFKEETESVFGTDFKYTEPFHVISKDGLKILNQIVDQNMGYMRSARQHAAIRGLGYRSRFIRDLNQCSLLTEYFSDLMGFKLQPHPIAQNYSQVNFGFLGREGQDVDQWHFDSVECVLIIGLSDMSQNVGGEIQVVNAPHAVTLIDKARRGEIPEDILIKIAKLKEGEGVFMRGSRLLHRVSPLLAGQTRKTMILSYHPVDPTLPDSTSFNTFKCSGDEAAAFEFAIHKAWRAHEMLGAFVRQEGVPNEEEMAEELQRVAKELTDTVGIFSGQLKEIRKY